MQAPTDLFARHQQELAEQAAQGERARVANVQRFVQMWLTLGQDCIRAAGSQHRPEIDEALGLATHRWGRLLDMKQQVIREEQQLVARGAHSSPPLKPRTTNAAGPDSPRLFQAVNGLRGGRGDGLPQWIRPLGFAPGAPTFPGA
jgi:hypothetical protein